MPEDPSSNNPAALAALIGELRQKASQTQSELDAEKDAHKQTVNERNVLQQRVSTLTDSLNNSKNSYEGVIDSLKDQVSKLTSSQGKADQEALRTANVALYQKVADAEAKAETAVADQEALRAETVALHQKVLDAEAKAETACHNHLVLAAKWDQLYGPAEEGIVLGPQPYITQVDNQHHATLEAARHHFLSVITGLDPMKTRELIGNSEQVISLLQRATATPIQTPTPTPTVKVE